MLEAVSHTGVAVSEAHVVSSVHCTQRIVTVLHMGVSVREAHWAVSVHSAIDNLSWLYT